MLIANNLLIFTNYMQTDFFSCLICNFKTLLLPKNKAYQSKETHRLRDRKLDLYIFGKCLIRR